MKKLLAVCLILAGCSSASHERIPDDPAPREAAPAPAPKERPAAAALSGLTLEQALEQAGRDHPDVVLARERIRASEGRELQAGLFPNPVLIGRMESAPFEGGTTGKAEYLAGLSQRLPVGGRLGAAREAEELERERLRKELEVRLLEVGARVRGAFATALYAAEAARLQSGMFDLAKRAGEVARARLEAGDATSDEVARVQMEEIRVRIEMNKAEGLRLLAFSGLASAMGDPEIRIETLEGALETALDLPTLGAVLASLEDGPYAALARADVEAARGRVDLAKVERIPDVTLDLLYRRLEESETNAFDVGVSIPLPAFDRNQGKIREAEADRRAAEARGRATRHEAVKRVREAHIKASEALSRARLFREELIPKSETILRVAEARYAGGDLSLAEVLPIRRDAGAVRLSYLEALREGMEGWGELRGFLR